MVLQASIEDEQRYSVCFLNCQAPLFKQILIFRSRYLNRASTTKILRVFICSQWSCQVQLPWGALWYSVIACVQLAVSIGLLRGPLRCSGKKRSTASTIVQVELEVVVFVISGSRKRVLPVLPRAYSEWHRLMLHEKNAHVTPWFGWSYCSNVFLMLVPSFAVSAREFNGVVAASELLLLDFARKPVVPLAMDLVETRPTSSRVDTSQENGDGNHRKYHSNWRMWRF